VICADIEHFLLEISLQCNAEKTLVLHVWLIAFTLLFVALVVIGVTCMGTSSNDDIPQLISGITIFMAGGILSAAIGFFGLVHFKREEPVIFNIKWQFILDKLEDNILWRMALLSTDPGLALDDTDNLFLIELRTRSANIQTAVTTLSRPSSLPLLELKQQMNALKQEVAALKNNLLHYKKPIVFFQPLTARSRSNTALAAREIVLPVSSSFSVNEERENGETIPLLRVDSRPRRGCLRF
jgi:hypothetical protein